MLSRALCLVLAATFTLGPALQPAAADEAKKGKKGKKAKAGEEAALEGTPFAVKASELARITYQGPGRVQNFTQTGPKLWASAGFRYDEIDRDEFSIYLIRVNTHQDRVQIDLYTRKVSFFNEGGGGASYPILTASPAQPK